MAGEGNGVVRERVIGAIEANTDLNAIARESYEFRGIFHSEMAAILGLVLSESINLVIESGRARGQSTLLLAKYLGTRGVEIHSVERNRDDNGLFAEERLKGFANLHLHYGNSLEIVPRLIETHPDRRIAVLIDGPKGEGALDLLCACIGKSKNVTLAFVHDLMKRKGGVPFPARSIAEASFARIFFTDDEEYVGRYRWLDDSIFAAAAQHGGRARPYYKGDTYIGSYGPTLAIVFPTEDEFDRARAGKPLLDRAAAG